ncbi:MAG: diguanylate cyclase [Magnetococcales bacterium]|nr:diguanylate cyclase [Magnetococcales bacterium]
MNTQADFVSIPVGQLDRIVVTMANSMADRDALQEILDVMGNSVLVINGHGRITRVNDAACDLLGYTRRALCDMGVGEILVEGPPWMDACMLTVSHQGAIRNLESWLLSGQGQKIPVLVSVSALRSRDGEIDGYVCAAQDISEHQRLQEALRASMESFQSIVEKSVDGILILGDEGWVEFVNHSATLLLGRESEEMIGLPFGFPVVSGNVTELDVMRKNGELGIAEMRTVATRWQEQDALLVSLRDVTENVRLREQLRQLSMEDELTGLNNRRGFFLLASQELTITQRSNARFLLFFIDLDGMKPINDTLGHKFGDQALIETATIMRRAFRKSDILARLGGDEFLALSLCMEKNNPADNILARLEGEIARNNARPGRAFRLSLSIGHVEVNKDSSQDLEQLIREADAQMYRIKMAKKQAV